MTTYRVDELEAGPLLDAAVAKALGAYLPACTFGPPPYSKDLRLGMPLLFAENIALLPPGFPDCRYVQWHACTNPYIATDGEWAPDLYTEGPTPLVAGLRCWLRLKVGEEIEL